MKDVYARKGIDALAIDINYLQRTIEDLGDSFSVGNCPMCKHKTIMIPQMTSYELPYFICSVCGIKLTRGNKMVYEEFKE